MSLDDELNFESSRYKVKFIELEKGGPAGYESTLLGDVADEIPNKIYEILSSYKYKPLVVEEKKLDSGRNFDNLSKTLKEKGNYGIVSGWKPSGHFHFGHKLLAKTLKFFQENGSQIFTPVANLEAELDTRLSKEEYTFYAADNLVDLGASGLNLDAAYIYLQSEEHRVMNLAYWVGREQKFKDVLDIYGANKLVEGFPFTFAGLTQIGDILLPQHQDFNNEYSFMLSGPDQDGHMKMTLRLSNKAKGRCNDICTVPSSLYIPHVPSLDGKKMSSSRQDSTIYLGPGENEDNLINRKELVDTKIGNMSFSSWSTKMKNLFKEFRKGNNKKGISEEIKSVLEKHQRRREEVINYAYGEEDIPSFWKVPEEAIVPVEKRVSKTDWKDMIKMSPKVLKP